MRLWIWIWASLCMGLVPGVKAENAISFSEEGITYTLRTDSYVYGLEDTVTLHYQIQNDNHLGILLPFSDSRRANFTIQTPYGVTGSQFETALLVTGQEYIAKGEVFVSNLKFNLSAFNTIINDTVRSQMFSAKDGDTINILGKSRAGVFGIDQPGLEAQTKARWEQAKDSKEGDENFDSELDTNVDGVISFPDFINLAENHYILNWQDFPEQAKLNFQIIIRTKSSDLNRDGQLNFEDFIYFSRAFGTNHGDQDYNARGDLDGNGLIDFSDFIWFVNLYQKK